MVVLQEEIIILNTTAKEIDMKIYHLKNILILIIFKILDK